MAEESGQTVVEGLFEHILPLVPHLPDRLRQGIELLDVGCGSGRALMRMAEQFPASQFHGYDFSSEAVHRGREAAASAGLSNLHFDIADAAEIADRQRFDVVTAFDAIHDQAKPDRVLRNIHQALRPGGVFLMQDIAGTSHVHEDCAHPLGAFLYSISCMHCMSVSLAAEGAGLGAMWGKDLAMSMLNEAGFTDVVVQSLPHDIMNYYYVARKET